MEWSRVIGATTSRYLSVDLDARYRPMLDRHVRRRKYRREVIGHVGMVGSTFEVAKHLRRKLARRVDTAAFRPDTEALGSLLVQVASILLLAVCVDSHR